MKSPEVRYPVTIAVLAGVLGVALHFVVFAFIEIEHLSEVSPPAAQPVLFVQESEQFDWAIVDPATLFLPAQRSAPAEEPMIGLPLAEILPPYDFSPSPQGISSDPQWISSREATAPPVAFLLQEDRNEFARFSQQDRGAVTPTTPQLFAEVLNLATGERFSLPALPLPDELLPASGELNLSVTTFLYHANLAPLESTPFLLASSSIPAVDSWLAQTIRTPAFLPASASGYLQITFHP